MRLTRPDFRRGRMIQERYDLQTAGKFLAARSSLSSLRCSHEPGDVPMFVETRLSGVSWV